MMTAFSPMLATLASLCRERRGGCRVSGVDRLTWTATSLDPLRALQHALDRTLVEWVAEQVGFAGGLDALDTLHVRDDATSD
jgi:hypothetical protein